MFAATVVVVVLLAAGMLATFARKVRHQGDDLRDSLGVGSRVWMAIGVLELAAALGLLAGLVVEPLGVAAAVGVVLVMVGAVVAHLRVRIGGAALAPPLSVLAVAVAAVALRLASS